MTNPAPRPRPRPAAADDAAPELPAALVRPRPRPRPETGTGTGTDAAVATAPETPSDDAPSRTGRLAALLRHPRAQRRAAVGAAATGAVLFVVASVVVSSASADSAAHRRPLPRPTTLATTSAAPTTSAAAVVTAAPRKVLARTPVHAKTKASAGHGAISALSANGIPKVALNAYRVAAARMANVDPGCGIDWSLLAGIGREESDHGRFGGAVLHADGVSTPRIIGPALDGIHWDYIAAPGNGAELDGDTTYAHALGPMQFIPSTWATYGADADGDGKADIFDINDAALGAARYLCAAGGNLRTVAGRTRAVLSYNHNDQYLAQVLALADAYKHGVAITGLPVGITTGTLPTIANTGYIPPANPGDPTAAGGSLTSKPTHSKSGTKSGTASSSPHPGGSTATRPAGGTTSSHASGGGSGSGSGGSGSGGSSGSGSGGSGSGGSGGSGSGGSGGSGGGSGGGSSSSPNPQPAPTSSAPVPSPTSTCTPLQHLLHQC